MFSRSKFFLSVLFLLAAVLCLADNLTALAGTPQSYTPQPTPYTGSELWYCARGTTDGSCSTSNLFSAPGFANSLSSPPCIGCTAPGLGQFLTPSNADNSTNAVTTAFLRNVGFSRTLQSFGADPTGAADSTTAVQAALASGAPLFCSGTFKLSSLITVTNTNVGLESMTAKSCVFNLTTSTSVLYFNEAPANTVELNGMTVNVQAVITAPGSAHPAAIDIEYPTGGTNNGPQTSVVLKRVYVGGGAGVYSTHGIYLNNTNVTYTEDVMVYGDVTSFHAGGAGVVYATNNSGSTFTSIKTLVLDYAYGIYLPQSATHGFQGVRIYNLDCVYCQVGVLAFGALDGLSDQLVVIGGEGAVSGAGVSVANVNHVLVSENYWFLINVPGAPVAANPLCYGLAWTIAIPSNGATNSVGSSTCDGNQVTGYASRIGVNISGVSNTNMASVILPNTLSNLNVGVQIQSATAGWLINKQSTKNVTTEINNGGTAGANTFVPPLWEPLTAAQLTTALPCAAATKGQQRYITDAAATPVYNATMTGGGSIGLRVGCNGTNWVNE